MRAEASPPGGAEPWPLVGELWVLLVMADTAMSDLCRQWLVDAGYQVGECSTGPGALDHAIRLNPEVIILDACADPPAAVRFAQGLKAGPDTCGIPLLAVIPQEQDLDTPGSLESAVDDCLTRPLRRWELLVRLRSMTRLGQNREELAEVRSLHGEQTRMWGVLLEFARRASKLGELEPLLEHIVQAAAELTSSRRVSLMLPDEHQQHLTIARSIGIDPAVVATVRVPIGEAISGQAYRTGRPVTTLEGHKDLVRRRSLGFRSFVSMPMIYTTMDLVHQRVGVLNVSDRYGDRPFDEWELEYIDLLGSIAGSAIDDIQSRQAREGLVRLDRDQELARIIQRSALPQRLPAVQGFEIDAWSEPVEQAAGDTYDVIGFAGRAGDGAPRLSIEHADRALLMLADATGHGIAPALSMTQVRSMLRMAARMGANVARIACHLNEELVTLLPGGRFVTAWLGEIDGATGTLASFSAGLGPILVYRAGRGEFDVLPTDTMPLGVAPAIEFAVPQPCPLEPGDVLAVLSDGLLESASPQGEHFGAQRAMEVIAANCRRNATRIRQALRRAVAEFTEGAPAVDDRTAVIAKRVGR
jgi:serine phosphatase RsbU (regulator of sigma subunit)/DNA-binding response OmpR family regulator